ncbi:MAG TPA: glycosyltransferase family 39 protein [Pyrinomonadaceae bacterium]|jgi:4-amino-4-deoxy-L-arabinose transferase-like glycosyltransferase|nr:glycosyltransferase family 39 protein [Pyrinomonadaceae bacterium]
MKARRVLVPLAVLALGALMYGARAGSNPPGFYIDESSVAYNAHLVAETGRDEHGEEWPLFFRCFGDYKNPVYVYLMAAVFSATGPSILAARLTSAALGLLTAVLLGMLAARVSGRRGVGLFVLASALVTPWLFELSRVVVEVAAYPAAVALLLFFVHRASLKESWSWADAALVAAALALVTYTYSIGRLLGPLLALGLALFARRGRRLSVVKAWALYAAALVPLLVYMSGHPNALTARFRALVYVSAESSYLAGAWEFVKHYAANLSPWWMLVTGDPNPDQIANILGTPLVLAVTFALALAGAWLVVRGGRRGAWWCFVLYGLAVSFVPASLTRDYFHMLRLSPVPVFLLVLTVPAVDWLSEGARRKVLFALLALTLMQGAVFQWQYHASARSLRRLHVFDADYPALILPAALRTGARPVHIADAPNIPGYIQAFWHSTLQGVPLDTFALLRPEESAPEGAVVITTEDPRPRCRPLAQSEPYTACVAEGPPRSLSPLPAEGFRAELRVVEPPARLSAGEKLTLRVVVRNAGAAVWRTRDRVGSPFQVSLGNHWLRADGTAAVDDDGRSPLLRDLAPGEEVEMPLAVNAPPHAGDYLLELDVLQEGVSWFGLRGSRTVRLPVRIE